MKMSEEMALRLHRMMWSDMQKELGDNPSAEERIEYKMKWIGKYFPGELIDNNCWLCQFTHTPYSGAPQCKNCPIKWPHDSCTDISMHYQSAPISEILALPARNGYLARLDDEKVVVDSCSYYKFREDMLSKASGIPASSAIEDHVKAIVKKAVEDKDRLTKRHIEVKHSLAQESGLDHGRPVADHIKKIRDDAFSDGENAERDRIMDRIGDLLNHDLD